MTTRRPRRHRIRRLGFFVSSATSATGNLGGIAGADAICLRDAAAVGRGRRPGAPIWCCRDPTNNNLTTHARNRIGSGPWHSANLVLVANNVAELHARTGDATLFVDERGQRINGQWTGSPAPNEHDIGRDRMPTARWRLD